MSEQLVKSLLAGVGLSHDCSDPQLIETHISWLVLVGEFAYKLKKPVNLGFLDFSTLALRKHYCEEEIRLNRRTAPDIYVDVQPISGTPGAPRMGDSRQTFEYAVRMRRFDNTALVDRLAKEGQLDEPFIIALAKSIARFHDIAGGTQPTSEFGTPAAIRAPADDNLRILTEATDASRHHRLLDELTDWSDTAFTNCKQDFARRRNLGFVRECHGDLHLGNILYRNGQCVLFDCIEFNPALRWIDVASDIAFTIMDIESHGESPLAWLLMNEYFQLTGDYGALAVLDYYKVYRALVRAKVAAIRAGQDPLHAGQLRRDCRRHLELAAGFTAPRLPCVLLMSGLSGTGKTWVARKLSSALGAVHIRSDVERKRLFGLDIDADSRSRGLDIYTPEANERTFDALAMLVVTAISRQFPVVVDATFIEHGLRQRFETLARQSGVPWAIVACTASEAIVKRRLATRSGDASEAGYRQYLDQRKRTGAFDAEESRHLVTVDTGAPDPVAGLASRVRRSLGSPCN